MRRGLSIERDVAVVEPINWPAPLEICLSFRIAGSSFAFPTEMFGDKYAYPFMVALWLFILQSLSKKMLKTTLTKRLRASFIIVARVHIHQLVDTVTPCVSLDILF